MKRAERSDALHEDAPEYCVNGSDQTMTRLSRVRWDFADASASRRSIHAFHSYPARFILLKAAAQYGFKLVFKSNREINSRRKSFNLHPARIKREHILVWER